MINITNSKNQQEIFDEIKKALSEKYTVESEVQIDKYYIIDIYIKELKICIEIDGLHHFKNLD